MKIWSVLFLFLVAMGLNNLLPAQTPYKLKHQIFYFESDRLIAGTDNSDPVPGDVDQRNFSIGQHNIVVHNGVFYHAYYDNRSGDYNIYLRTSEDGMNWSDLSQVNDDTLGNDQYNPTLVVYDDGGTTHVVVAWQDIKDGQHKIRSARSTDGGQSFSPSVEIGAFTNVYATYPNIAIGEYGTVYIICFQFVTSWSGTDRKVWFSKSTDNGQTWSDVVNIWENGSEWDYPPDIVAQGQKVMVINNLGPFSNQQFAHLYYTSSQDSGNTWQSPSPIVQYHDSLRARYPSAVVDANGTVHTLWFQGQFAGDNNRFMFSKSTDWGQSWSEEVQVNNTSIVKEEWRGHWMATSLAISDNGTLYAVWQDERRNPGSDNYDIYLSYSTDGGQTWSSDTLVNNTIDAHQAHPSIAVKSGAVDTVLIVWQEENIATGINDGNTLTPGGYHLAQNYPNPFNPTTTIRFQLPQSGLVSLKVYDMTGKEVVVLVNEPKPAGIYQVHFDAGQLASGVYFYILQAGNFQQTRKMLLLR
ncbi:MAG: T9SS C-terminal target domain-containing protein [Calditrichaeota bacterium]|nr:MAG: T9SS C-terminal target domain-containing protein [Calditrichota bacterium]